MVGINYQKEDIESIHVHILILVISCNTCEIMSRVRHESKSLVHMDVRARKKKTEAQLSPLWQSRDAWAQNGRRRHEKISP